MDSMATSEMTLPSVNEIRSNVMSNVPGYVGLGLAILGIILAAVALILYSTINAPPTMSYKLKSITLNSSSIYPEMNTLYELKTGNNSNLTVKQLTKGYTQGVVSYYKNMNTSGDITITPESSGTPVPIVLKPGKGAMLATGKNGYSAPVIAGV